MMRKWIARYGERGRGARVLGEYGSEVEARHACQVEAVAEGHDEALGWTREDDEGRAFAWVGTGWDTWAEILVREAKAA